MIEVGIINALLTAQIVLDSNSKSFCQIDDCLLLDKVTRFALLFRTVLLLIFRAWNEDF